MEGEEEVKSKPESMKSHMAIRCAKAAILVASLKASSPNRYHQDQDEEEEEEDVEKEATEREIRFLRTEKLRSSRRMKLCGLMEIALQVLVVLSASTLLLVVDPCSGTS